MLFTTTLLRFGETTIENAKNIADIITIDAPMGKSIISDNKNPMRQLAIPITGEIITIFLKS